MSFDLSRSRPESCLSDLALDRLLAGELSGEEHVLAETHLAGCTPCGERLATLRLQARSFPSEIWIAGEAARARRGLRAGNRGRVATAAAAATLAAAAIAMFAVTPAIESTRTKGSDPLELIARHADGRIETILPGQTLSPGDAVRFRLHAAKAGWLVIVGIDSAGQVTSYVPADGDRPLAIQAGEVVPDGSIVLDDTLGAERIVAVVCDDAPSLAAITGAARGALDHAQGDPSRVGAFAAPCRTSSFLIRKAAQE